MTLSLSTGSMVCNCSVCRRVNAAPMRRSNSILADTAFACRSSRATGASAARRTCLWWSGQREFDSQLRRRASIFPRPTHALSVLLNLARFTSRLRFPNKAWFMTSVPMCSPSRSQSVHMNNAFAYLACSRMFFAMAFLSCVKFQSLIVVSQGRASPILLAGHLRTSSMSS